MSLGSSLIPLCVMALFAFLSAFWSAAETALFSLSHADRVRLKRQSPQVASQIAFLLGRPRELLITLLLGSATVSTAYYVVASMLAVNLDGLAAVGVSIASLLLLVVAGEILPKTLASLHPLAFARLLTPVLTLWFRAISPVRRLIDQLFVTPFSRLVGPAAPASGRIGVDDLGELLEAGTRSGTLQSAEQRLLGDVLQMGTMRIREVMIPRVDMHWMDERATGHLIAEMVLRTGAERLAVMRGGMDGTLLGIFDARQYIAARAAHQQQSGRGELPITPYIALPSFVPDAARLDQLLEHFRSTHTSLAFCVDEAGSLTGVVSVNDIVSQLLNSHPVEADDDSDVRQVSPGSWLVSGRLSVRDWQEFFGAEMPDAARVSTVSGLLTACLGRLPRVGDEVVIARVRLRVQRLRGRVADQILVSLQETSA
jgi:putative hemolysin